MSDRIATVSMLVDDYDTAKSWFERALGFTCIEDTTLSPTKRWVVMRAAGGESGADILLAKAAKAEQVSTIGKQGGGRVWLFLETSDFETRYQRLREEGVTVLEEPRDEAYGRVVQFQDSWGNRWDLLQRTKKAES